MTAKILGRLSLLFVVIQWFSMYAAFFGNFSFTDNLFTLGVMGAPALAVILGSFAVIKAQIRKDGVYGIAGIMGAILGFVLLFISFGLSWGTG